MMNKLDMFNGCVGYIAYFVNDGYVGYIGYVEYVGYVQKIGYIGYVGYFFLIYILSFSQNFYIKLDLPMRFISLAVVSHFMSQCSKSSSKILIDIKISSSAYFVIFKVSNSDHIKALYNSQFTLFRFSSM